MMDRQPVDGLGVLESSVRKELVEHLAELFHSRDLDAATPPGRTARELAELTGLHVTTVRFHLERLVGAGFLHAHFEPPTGVGRPRKIYTSHLSRWPEPTTSRHHEALAGLHAELEAGEDGPARAEEAGLAWARARVQAGPGLSPAPARTPGTWLAKIGRLIDELTDWGYGPNVRTTGASVELTLHYCPFLAMATEDPDVVCAAHRGLLRGTLEAIGEPEVRVSLQPKVGPHACRAHLRTMTPLTGGPA